MLSASVILALASLGGVRAEVASVPTQAMPLIPLGPFVRAANGDILALNDGWIRRSTDGGASWKGARMFPGGDYEALNDSALLVTKSGRVVAFFIDRKTLRYEGPAQYTDISVRDGLGNVLYSTNAANPVGGNVLHDFTSSPLTAQQLEIKFGQGWWIAMDDVTFSQAVPEPGTMLVLGAGLVALARRRRATK